MKRRSTLLVILIAYASFIGQGLPGGLLGVAWPSIRHTFGLRLDAIAALLTVATIGSLLTALTSGAVVARIGIGRFLLAGTVSAVIGLVGYALTPGWWVMVACGLLVGAAAGAVDAGLNAYFAANHSARLMNWLHACFGLGAMLGPLLMTALLTAGQSWRWGYVAVAVAQALVVVGLLLTLDRWEITLPAADAAEAGGVQLKAAPATATLMLPLVWLGVLIFFLMSGTETAAGQWSYSLFIESRAVPVQVAGLWVGVYWAALTGGRILHGLTGDRLSINAMVRASTIALTAGAALVWWNPSDLLGFLGLALMGLGFAPIFPLLQLVTPSRVGLEHAANAIGFQSAAGYLGMGLMPGLAGMLAERWGLEVVGPFLLAGSLGMLVLYEIILRRDRQVVCSSRV